MRAASVNHADWFVTTGRPYVMRAALGLRRPRVAIRGRDLAGRVEAVGAAVTRFRPGDDVYAETTTGSFAEFARVPDHLLALKPANLSFEQAAAVPVAGVTALQGLRDVGGVQPGQAVLINRDDLLFSRSRQGHPPPRRATPSNQDRHRRARQPCRAATINEGDRG